MHGVRDRHVRVSLEQRGRRPQLASRVTRRRAQPTPTASDRASAPADPVVPADPADAASHATSHAAAAHARSIGTARTALSNLTSHAVGAVDAAVPRHAVVALTSRTVDDTAIANAAGRTTGHAAGQSVAATTFAASRCGPFHDVVAVDVGRPAPARRPVAPSPAAAPPSRTPAPPWSVDTRRPQFPARRVPA